MSVKTVSQTISADTTVSREYWLAVLGGLAPTRVPRWSEEPDEGIGTIERVVPDDLHDGLERLARRQAVPVATLVLAAHVKVLAVLSGERQVTTGYVAVPGRAPVPCRVAVPDGSWRDLVHATALAESELLPHHAFPVVELREELGLSGPAFETELDPTGGSGPLSPETVLGVAVSWTEGRPRLVLRHRREVLDAGAALRLVDYHLTALAHMAADPDVPHGEASLVGPVELRAQVTGLAGPRRELPDLRLPDLFARRAASHPDRVAAEHGDQALTYAALDDRVNRIGRALLDRGLRPEDVVAVVTGRNLDWMASVLAVLRAGGTYLPIEPQFPVDRIAAMLRRSGCRLALTEPGRTAMFDLALERSPGICVIPLDTVDRAGPISPPLVPARANQLAYLYFTSGSTGEPKGALCEHAGMLNHLYAKVHDLDLREGAVVAQTAPQCFDISLWQLVAGLLVGGRTVLVDQEAILDVDRFLDTLVDHRVQILQVVPSYLDVVLSRLEAEPRDLPDLRCVSVTGEPLPRDLIRRWFVARPGVPLVNAYGLTETSDDTNHEVMWHDPDDDRVPLGRPIANVHVYVVDEQLRPVPLGAPGEIVFSGVCVGRGYVNDPDRTAAAFLDDPLRPGERLYRSGDVGRWRPDGKLEFLGRRDTQVKVRGFRVELGEVETALTRLPGVRRASVVVDESAGSARLVAYVTGDRRLEAQDLRGRLADALPSYMVPSLLQQVSELPLTANGKVDTAKLRADARSTGSRTTVELSPAERRVAAAWAEVLDVPLADIGPDAHFADLGGTSLTAVRLVVALDRAVTLREVRACPVLADLARLLEGAPR